MQDKFSLLSFLNDVNDLYYQPFFQGKFIPFCLLYCKNEFGNRTCSKSYIGEPSKRKSCFVPLLNVLSLHSNLLSQTIDKNQQMDYAVKVWTRLIGQIPDDRSSLTVYGAEFPTIVRDPIALILQIVLTLPMNLDKGYFRCAVQVLYNFLCIRSLLQISCKLDYYRRNEFRRDVKKLMSTHNEDCDISCRSACFMTELKELLGFIINIFDSSSLYMEYDEMPPTQCLVECTDEALENSLREHSLHFLKIAALLQSHLFEENILITAEDNEFEFYCKYLGLTSEPQSKFTAVS
ncbi:hypothetical protein JTE90_003589 [Oedothorax gibbosus]|uniref:E3 ubiquitin-protein ligase n=1 Tax=Oedothorax gibbosus TaxID=931172 RepID=A0AAV6TNE9_9ARAC|nr:hypothetical protein JTE90_003589 [Oedothorax gibbosus]